MTTVFFLFLIQSSEYIIRLFWVRTQYATSYMQNTTSRWRPIEHTTRLPRNKIEIAELNVQFAVKIITSIVVTKKPKNIECLRFGQRIKEPMNGLESVRMTSN